MTDPFASRDEFDWGSPPLVASKLEQLAQILADPRLHLGLIAIGSGLVTIAVVTMA